MITIWSMNKRTKRPEIYVLILLGMLVFWVLILFEAFRFTTQCFVYREKPRYIFMIWIFLEFSVVHGLHKICLKNKPCASISPLLSTSTWSNAARNILSSASAHKRQLFPLARHGLFITHLEISLRMTITYKLFFLLVLPTIFFFSSLFLPFFFFVFLLSEDGQLAGGNGEPWLT